MQWPTRISWTLVGRAVSKVDVLRGWSFYNFIGAGRARFMCGWDTAPETVDRLVGDVRELAGES